MSRRFSKGSKLIRKSLIKVYDHLKKVWKKFNDLSKKFGQSLGTPPLKVRITQTTQTNTNFFIGLVEFGRILPPDVYNVYMVMSRY